LNLPSLAGWEVHEVWGRLGMRRVKGDPFQSSLFFFIFFKFPNLGHRFGTNPNLSTFFYLKFFSSIIFYEMGFIQVE
jgi:hypothetical protein